MVNSAPNEPAPKLKEIIAAAVSGAIVVIVLWMLCCVFVAAGSDLGEKGSAKYDAYARQKDILTIGLGLLGAVTGYYLGRAPAELRASQARQSAKKAEDKLSTTEQQLSSSMAETQKIKADAKALLVPMKKLLKKAQTEKAGKAGKGKATLSAEPDAEVEADTEELEELNRQLDALMNEVA
jgi:hypothetical protein